MPVADTRRDTKIPLNRTLPIPWKPTPAQLRAARNKRVPDLIAKDLIVLFAGINPGLYTAAIGRHVGWDEGREPYDHQADPRELTNLAADPAQAATLAGLSQQLRTAAAASFPPDGKTPEIREGLWAPNLTDP